MKKIEIAIGVLRDKIKKFNDYIEEQERFSSEKEFKISQLHKGIDFHKNNIVYFKELIEKVEEIIKELK